MVVNDAGGDATSPPPLTADEAKALPTWRAAYSDRTAVMMSKFAHYAYLPFAEEKATSPEGASYRPTQAGGLAQLEALLKGGGFRLIGEPFSCNDSQGFVAINDEEMAVLAFRGTANWGDWEINLNAGLMPMPGFEHVRVHRGFWNAFESTLEPMMKAVAQVPADLGLYITGHSLGGALAQIAAAALSDHDNVAACYTFGSPRVATLRFDTDVKCPHYRVIDNWDLVPGVPPPAWWGYLHTGDPRLLRDDMPRLAFRRDRDLIPRFVVDLWSLLLWPFTGQISSVNDHMIWNYRKKLESVRAARAPNKPTDGNGGIRVAIAFDRGEPPGLRSLAESVEVLYQTGQLDDAERLVKQVNSQLFASGATCRLVLPDEPVEAIADTATGRLIYRCGHRPPHRWDLSGQPLR